ncbi:MAG: GNAT family N-acetyltransferase [Tepidisphaeraceae bacterium]
MAAKPSSNSAPTIEHAIHAIEVFVRGFAFVRSGTHPYEPHRVGKLWVVRDGPRKRAEDYRREEWIAHGIEAAEVDAIARKQTRGRFCICAVRTLDEPDGPIRAGYKAAGYRLGATEAFMVHRLAKIPKVPQPLPVERVMTQNLADRLIKAAGRRHIQSSDLVPDAPQRQYVALDGATPIGWAASITVKPSPADGTWTATWVQSMYVRPAFRRRGIGKSILAKMLRDDRAHGSAASYLLASHAGAMLYPNVGYEAIGELLVYTPRK